MRITRLALKNIGPFEDAVFEIPEAPGPGEVVLFEGPNGCGKTTIAEAIALAIAGLVEEQKQRPVPRRVLARMHGRDATFAMDLGEPGGGRISLNSSKDSTKVRFDEELSTPVPLQKYRDWQVPLSWSFFSYRAHLPTPSMSVTGPKAIDHAPLAGSLTFIHDDERRASIYFGQFLTNLEYDRVRAETYAREQPSGEYALAAASARAAIARVERVLSRVLDRHVEIHFPFRQTAPQILFDGEEIPFELLGEGMRSTVSWLADLLVRLERISWEDASRSPLDQDFWLILDEIDEGLHPQLQMRLFPALRELFPRARIYATTHSPFVVASLGDGVVFPIRPAPKTHRVSGMVAPKPLRHGQSLALVVEEIFQTPSDFIDADTRDALARHREAVDALRRDAPIDWRQLRRDRSFLMALNDEVATVVAMREVPARKRIEAGLAEHDEAAE